MKFPFLSHLNCDGKNVSEVGIRDPFSLRWRHNGHVGVSNHQPHHRLLNGLFGRRSKQTSKLRVTGLCVGNSPGTGEFPAQMASNAENVSIWWRHHACEKYMLLLLEQSLFAHHYSDTIMSAMVFWLFAQPIFQAQKTPKLRVTGLCEWNAPVTGGFPSQRASDAENVSIWWRHRVPLQLSKYNKNRTRRIANRFELWAPEPFVKYVLR